MERKGIWIVTGAIVLGSLIFGISQGVAQRDFRTEGRGMDTHVPRYQVVNVTETEVIIMDVTTGDLYSAKPKDVKPFATRPRPSGVAFDKDGEFPKDKDKPRFDKDGFDKDRFKDKDKQ